MGTLYFSRRFRTCNKSNVAVPPKYAKPALIPVKLGEAVLGVIIIISASPNVIIDGPIALSFGGTARRIVTGWRNPPLSIRIGVATSFK